MRDRVISERELAERGERAVGELRRVDRLWPGQLATAAALLLFLVLPQRLTIGPSWPLPAAEGAVLLGLVWATRSGLEVRRRRVIAIGLVLVAIAASLISLGLL